MAGKYVKDLENAVAKKSAKKVDAKYKKALSENTYRGPKGKSPGHMINVGAAAKMGKLPSDILSERSEKNYAASKAIQNSADDVKPIYSVPGVSESYKGMTGGRRGKFADKLNKKASRQRLTAIELKRRGF